MIKQREIIINTFAIMCHLKQAESINSAIVLLFFEDMVLNQLFKRKNFRPPLLKKGENV